MERKKAILCVDDELVILFSVVQELKRAFGSRFLYEQATDADQAFRSVEELAEEGISIIFIISDWLMPGMRGDEFLERIHESHPEILAIMITGQADQASIDRVRRNSSVVAIFNKPWDPEELVRVIEENSNTLTGDR